MSARNRRPAFLAPLAAAFLAAMIGLLPGPADAVDVTPVVSPGGITAWLVRDPRNPIINLRFAFRGGAALDPAGKEGLASMVAGLLDEGVVDPIVQSHRDDSQVSPISSQSGRRSGSSRADSLMRR